MRNYIGVTIQFNVGKNTGFKTADLAKTVLTAVKNSTEDKSVFTDNRVINVSHKEIYEEMLKGFNIMGTRMQPDSYCIGNTTYAGYWSIDWNKEDDVRYKLIHAKTSECQFSIISVPYGKNGFELKLKDGTNGVHAVSGELQVYISIPSMRNKVMYKLNQSTAKLAVHYRTEHGELIHDWKYGDLNVAALVKAYGKVHIDQLKEEENSREMSYDDYSRDTLKIVGVNELPVGREVYYGGKDKQHYDIAVTYECEPHSSRSRPTVTVIFDRNRNIQDIFLGTERELEKIKRKEAREEEKNAPIKVDEFLYGGYSNDAEPMLDYAKSWLHVWAINKNCRGSSTDIFDINSDAIVEAIVKKHNLELLYADYEGEQWRVSGKSNMGDIWLTKDLTGEVKNYDWRGDTPMRVYVNELSNWTNKLDEVKFNLNKDAK